MTSVTIVMSLAGPPWHRSTEPSPSISTVAVSGSAAIRFEPLRADRVGLPHDLGLAVDDVALAVSVDHHEPVAERPEEVEALARIRADHGVAAAQDEVGGLEIGLREHGLERGKIPVDVEESGYLHRTEIMADLDLPANALVLGLARSGQAAALALVRHGVTVLAVDRNEELDAGRLRAEGVEVRLGADDPALLDGVDLLVKSPGVPAEAPLVAAARERALPVWSEVELGSRLLPNPILGVTGTNGKTTTTELLGAIFRAAGRPSRSPATSDAR